MFIFNQILLQTNHSSQCVITCASFVTTMTAIRKHSLHFNQGLSKTHILSKILSGFKKQNTKATIIFETKVYQRRKFSDHFG
jgi:hypothetical protein